jgi:GntR family transcriptional regulator
MMTNESGILTGPFSARSFYEVLEFRHKLQPLSAMETLIAFVVNNEEADLLQVPPGSPALATERTTLLADGQPLEYAPSLVQGDRYGVILDLVRQP